MQASSHSLQRKLRPQTSGPIHVHHLSRVAGISKTAQHRPKLTIDTKQKVTESEVESHFLHRYKLFYAVPVVQDCPRGIGAPVLRMPAWDERTSYLRMCNKTQNITFTQKRHSGLCSHLKSEMKPFDGPYTLSVQKYVVLVTKTIQHTKNCTF